ncbi:condensation domain-containing protein, partial [Klebsiella pneumoniae]
SSPLLRAWFVERKAAGVLETAEQLFIVDTHHIISDGYSNDVLWRELTEIAKGAPLPALTLSYADYTCWQQHQDYRQRLAKQSTFWLDQFATL